MRRANEVSELSSNGSITLYEALVETKVLLKELEALKANPQSNTNYNPNNVLAPEGVNPQYTPPELSPQTTPTGVQPQYYPSGINPR